MDPIVAFVSLSTIGCCLIEFTFVDRKALTVMSENDTILIRTGWIDGDGNCDNKVAISNITVRSEVGDPNQVTIDCTGFGSCK
jgi:hypothetical protein